MHQVTKREKKDAVEVKGEKTPRLAEQSNCFFWHFVVSYVFFHCSSIWSWLHLYCLHSIVPCLHSMSQILSAIFCSPPHYIFIWVCAHNEKTSKADFTLLIFPSKDSVQFYCYSADLERLQSALWAPLSAAHLHTSHIWIWIFIPDQRQSRKTKNTFALTFHAKLGSSTILVDEKKENHQH